MPSPIACVIDSLTRDERARRQDVLTRLERRVTGMSHERDGLTFNLRNEPDTTALAGEFIGYEARCCPFLRFDLAVEAGEGTVTLRMSGPEGAGDFLRATFVEKGRAPA